MRETQDSRGNRAQAQNHQLPEPTPQAETQAPEMSQPAPAENESTSAAIPAAGAAHEPQSHTDAAPRPLAEPARWDTAVPNSSPTPPSPDALPHKSAFATTKAFGELLLHQAGKKIHESIFLWEHGNDVEPWLEPMDGAVLLDAIEATVKRFAVFPKWASETLALWVLHTYAFLLRGVSTYIGLESPQKRYGKTTVLAAR